MAKDELDPNEGRQAFDETAFREEPEPELDELYDEGEIVQEAEPELAATKPFPKVEAGANAGKRVMLDFSDLEETENAIENEEAEAPSAGKTIEIDMSEPAKEPPLSHRPEDIRDAFKDMKPSIVAEEEPAKKKAGKGQKVGMAVIALLLVVFGLGLGSILGSNGSEEQQAANQIETPDSNRGDDDGSGDGESKAVKDGDGEVIDDSIASLPASNDSKATEGDSGTSGDGSNEGSESSEGESSDDDESAGDENCDHDWKPYKAKTTTTEAVTKKVTTPAKTEVVTEYHTLCNVCKKKIDGKTKEHAAETGHEGYTTNVPVNVTKTVKKASTKTVTVKKATKTKTWSKVKCKKCGKVKKLDEAKSKTTEVD